jgi:hypothetical protein
LARVQVFISHADSDRSIAEAIRQRLAEEGLEAWTEQAVGAGESVSEAINEALEAADAYVLLLSKQWLGSEWALIELSGSLVRSMRHGRPLIPVVTERGVQVPAVLRDRHYLDISAHRNDMRLSDVIGPVVGAVADARERVADFQAVGSQTILDDASTVMSLELSALNASRTMFDTWLRAWMRWMFLMTILLGLAGVAVTANAAWTAWLAAPLVAAVAGLVLPLLRAQLAARLAHMVGSYVGMWRSR